jgi:hypothetical protein
MLEQMMNELGKGMCQRRGQEPGVVNVAVVAIMIIITSVMLTQSR